MEVLANKIHCYLSRDDCVKKNVSVLWIVLSLLVHFVSQYIHVCTSFLDSFRNLFIKFIVLVYF